MFLSQEGTLLFAGPYVGASLESVAPEVTTRTHPAFCGGRPNAMSELGRLKDIVGSMGASVNRLRPAARDHCHAHEERDTHGVRQAATHHEGP